jgi:class 3 adenylate cyclase
VTPSGDGSSIVTTPPLNASPTAIAARISAIAGAGEILTSRTLKDLTAGSGLSFEDRGVHALKGVPDEWQVYAVTG